MTRVAKWKPGTLLVDAKGRRGWVVEVTANTIAAGKTGQAWREGSCVVDADGNGWLPAEGWRPLAVIDPEDESLPFAHALWERLVDLGTSDFRVWRHRIREVLNDLADPKPRIEEPTGWLAAVIDDVGDKWVRDGVPADEGHWWNHTVAAEKDRVGVFRADWQAINVVRVLSDGVEAGESE